MYLIPRPLSPCPEAVSNELQVVEFTAWKEDGVRERLGQGKLQLPQYHHKFSSTRVTVKLSDDGADAGFIALDVRHEDKEFELQQEREMQEAIAKQKADKLAAEAAEAKRLEEEAAAAAAAAARAQRDAEEQARRDLEAKVREQEAALRAQLEAMALKEAELKAQQEALAIAASNAVASAEASAREAALQRQLKEAQGLSSSVLQFFSPSQTIPAFFNHFCHLTHARRQGRSRTQASRRAGPPGQRWRPSC
jgi:flagellar biosynthesis GTPase FlhF